MLDQFYIPGKTHSRELFRTKFSKKILHMHKSEFSGRNDRI